MKIIISRKVQSIAIAMSLLFSLIFMPNSIQAQYNYIPVQVERPFKKEGWIFARGYAQAYEVFAKMEITVRLRQKYGGRWHVVAERTGSLYRTSGIRLIEPVAVQCTNKQTPYLFMTEIRVVGTRFNGSTAVGENMYASWQTC